MGRHAYLIIAHNEFDVLRTLISMIDDERNDIYVHIDKKVRTIPSLSAQRSRLFVLDRRVDVRWGHVSQIETELLLFETALRNGPYSYYHLISGTHLPLVSQDRIHEYFEVAGGRNIFIGLCRDTEYQERLKLRSINLFLRNFSSAKRILARTSQFLWKVCIRVQRMLGLEVNKGCSFMKASNWVHISEPAVEAIVGRRSRILRKYRFSFCGDEFFVPTELSDSPLSDTLENREDVLYMEMGRSNPRTFSISELEDLKGTGCLFARKFKS